MTKKMTEKDRTILGQGAPYLIILVVLAGYAIFLYVVKRTSDLQVSDFINNITIFMGWIVALLTAVIYLSKTRKDSQKLKKEEIRRSLEIDAFREINRAVTNLVDAIADVSNAYFSWSSQLKLHLIDLQGFQFNKAELDSKISQQRVNLWKKCASFILAIEANEIVVIQFDHLRKYIQFEVDDINEVFRGFQQYLVCTTMDNLRKERDSSIFERKCMKIRDKLMSIQNYLFDYRIELMNSMLGEIFDSQVPVRKPRDPKYKTLTEVAIKEEVEKEVERRELKLLEQFRGKEPSSPKGPANQ